MLKMVQKAEHLVDVLTFGSLNNRERIWNQANDQKLEKISGHYNVKMNLGLMQECLEANRDKYGTYKKKKYEISKD